MSYVGDLGPDEGRLPREREWPGFPGAMRDHEGGGEIVTRPPAIVEEVDLEPLEGDEDDPWVKAWYAGRESGLNDATIRDRANKRLMAFRRLELLFELAVIVAIIVVVTCTYLSIH